MRQIASIKWTLLFSLINLKFDLVASTFSDIGLLHERHIYILQDVDTEFPSEKTHKIPLHPSAQLVHPLGMTYNKQEEKIYFGDQHVESEEALYSLNVDEDYKHFSDPEVLLRKINGTRHHFKRLHYDEVSNRILGLEIVDGIHSIQIDTDDYPEHIAKIGYNETSIDMLIDSKEQKIYWLVETNSSIVIRKLNIDGSDLVTVWEVPNNGENIYTDLSMHESSMFLSYYRKDSYICVFVQYSKDFNLASEKILYEESECNPHSVLVDEKFIYWTDKNRGALLRKSRSNYNKHTDTLLEMPHRIGKYGIYFVYDLISIKDRSEKEIGAALNSNPLQNLPVENSNSLLMNKNRTEQYSTERPTEESLSDFNTNTTNEDDESNSISIQSKKDGPTAKPNPGPLSRKFINIPVKKHAVSQIPKMFIEDEVTKTIIKENYAREMNCHELLYGVLCLVFFFTSLLLTAALVYSLRLLYVHKHKNSEPKKKSIFKTKTFCGPPPCSKSGNDGVSIDIEDCCQMTVCDSPCYSSVKKHGKGYKKSSQRTAYDSDMNHLLDDGV